MYVNGCLIRNINESNLNSFLRDKDCIRESGQEGQDTTLWIRDLLDKRKIKSQELNEFLFKELFYGKSNLINVFQIDSCRKLRDEDVWIERLSESYDFECMQFNKIISTCVDPDNPIKIAAIDAMFNGEGKITSIKMVLVRFIRIKLNGKESDSCCYVPIKFDLEKKLLFIKIRNQHLIPNPEQRPKATIDKIVEDFKSQMDFSTVEYNIDHQEVLYKMSKALLKELYESVPNYKKVDNMDDFIECFIKDTIDNIPIINKEKLENGEFIINEGVIDLKDELKRVLQHLVVADYFFNEDIDVFSKNNVSAVITSIKFNDKEENTARLTGENNAKAIVCSRTFMSMRKSIEAVQTVFALSIAYRRKRDNIEVKFDASDRDRLTILILNQKYYTEDDFEKIWRLYEKYEKPIIEEATRESQADIG